MPRQLWVHTRTPSGPQQQQEFYHIASVDFLSPSTHYSHKKVAACAALNSLCPQPKSCQSGRTTANNSKRHTGCPCRIIPNMLRYSSTEQHSPLNSVTCHVTHGIRYAAQQNTHTIPCNQQQLHSHHLFTSPLAHWQPASTAPLTTFSADITTHG